MQYDYKTKSVMCIHEKKNPNDCKRCLNKLENDYEKLLHQYCIPHDRIFNKIKDTCYFCTYNKDRSGKRDSLEPKKEFRLHESDAESIITEDE